MRTASTCLILVALIVIGCSNNDSAMDERLAAYENFCHKAFDAVAWQDVDGVLALCAQPGDHDLLGNPLVHGETTREYLDHWRSNHEQAVQRFVKELDTLGGIEKMTWVQMGKPIGLMDSESDFVGNMFIIVDLNGEQMAIEVGSSQMSQDRGRLLIDNQLFTLQPLSYYQEMSAIF